FSHPGLSTAHNRCVLRFVSPHSQNRARTTMPALITLGRVLFALPFIYSGATKLFGIQPTADFIAAVIPSFIIPYTSQLQAMTGMSTPQILAIAVGMFEVIAGLMIALNFGARFFAILLIFFVAATIYYFPPENPKTLMDALKSLSIIGALFIIVGYGRAPRKVEPAYGDVKISGTPQPIRNKITKPSTRMIAPSATHSPSRFSIEARIVSP